MATYEFTSIRRIDGKQKKVIVDICGDIINRNPTKEDLKGLNRQLSVREILKLPEEETKKYLLEFLRHFYDKQRRFPTTMDFVNNPTYPNFKTYDKVFGNLNNAMIEAGFELSTCKILVSKDGTNFEWVIIKDGKVIWNPVEEDLRNLNQKSYSRENICAICKKENNITDKSILYPKNVLLNTDRDGNKTEEYVCKMHGKRNYSHNNPNSTDNLKKSVSDRRTGNQDPNHQNYIGDLFEETTCIWRGVDNMNIVNDNYEWPIDHSTDVKLGTIQTKGRCYDHTRGCWEQNLSSLRDVILRGFDFDNLILYCTNKDRELIERIYIIPKREIIKRNSIKIVKNNSRGTGWYEEYRVNNDSILIKVNDIWKKVKSHRANIFKNSWRLE